MKKHLLSFVLLATLVCLTLSLFACSGGGRCASGHQWKTIEVTSPNGCFADGRSYDRCKVCGIKRYVDVEPIGHDMVLVEGTDSLPTCTEEGYEGDFACARENCDHTIKGVVIPALGHKDTDGDGICEVCQKDSCEHVWGEWEYVDHFTHTRTCLLDESHTETADHNFDEGIIYSNPTCIEQGEIGYKCKDCGYEEIDKASAVDHEYSENWTDNGSNHVKYCKFGCGEYLKASHNYVKTGRQPATCESAEIITFTCDCGNVKTAEGDPAIEHNYAWENNGDGTHKVICSECGVIDESEECYGDKDICVGCCGQFGEDLIAYNADDKKDEQAFICSAILI